MVEWWWTFEHFYMPEGIPLTTLIKVIIGAIGACQMPSLPSQLPRSPWTQLHALWRELGGRREARTGPRRPPRLRRQSGEAVWRGGLAMRRFWAYGTRPPSLSVGTVRKDSRAASGGPGFQTNTHARLYPRSRWLMFDPLRRARSVRSVVSHN